MSPGGGPDAQPDQVSFGGNGDGDADGDRKAGSGPSASVWGPRATSQGAAGEGAAAQGMIGPGPRAGLAIATSGLAKRFRGGQLAVDRIDLAVPPGSVYGFLGPNGSGKTTTIRMLLGLVAPDRRQPFAHARRDHAGGLDSVLPQGRLAGRGPGVLPVPVRPGQPGQVRRRRPDRRPAHRAGAGSTARWTGSACWPPRTSGTAPTRSA